MNNAAFIEAQASYVAAAMTDQATQDAPALPDHRAAVAGQVERSVRPEPCAWAVVYGDVTHSVCLSELGANLIAEDLRARNRGRDFVFVVEPVYRQSAIEGVQRYGWTPCGMVEDGGAGEFVDLRELF